MRNSPAWQLLLLAVLLSPLLQGSALASDSMRGPELLELRSFIGLKNLFHRLHRQIAARFEDEETARRVLVDSRSYRQYESALPAQQRQRLQLQVTQGISYWQQFQRVAVHVLGTDSPYTRISYPRAYAIFIGGESTRIPRRPGAIERDHFVESMNMLGYTPLEVADVISGRITLHALKQAGRMRSLGYSRAKIADYLDRQYQRERDATQNVGQSLRPTINAAHRAAREKFDRHVVRYASAYHINPDIIRAIISNESSWRSQVRSPTGAIGLMQLMPSTAAMLGVDPLDPEQNIEGGVRYLAALLEMFEGDLDAAVVGYNAGPAHARKWRDGSTVLYGETRNYLNRIKLGLAGWQF